MSQPSLALIAPNFIVRDLKAAISFYCEMLGFYVAFQGPDEDPFLAIVQRDTVMIFVKVVGVDPLPNCKRHPWARWDAYVNAPDPDALAAEFTSRGVTFSVPLQDTSDGLRGFELEDADGYVLFFGRPR